MAAMPTRVPAAITRATTAVITRAITAAITRATTAAITRAIGGYRGPYYGGYYGGWRGGYYGWGGWGWGGWGWGWPLAAGIYVATLPVYYSTLWYNGVPYYYADNTYYSWDPNANQYVTVVPPAGVASQAPAPAAGTNAPAGAGSPPPGGGDLMVYPKNGQSTEQQAKDKFECHQWAATQSGFDPTQGASNVPVSKQSDYMRAQAACLQGRGYSVM